MKKLLICLFLTSCLSAFLPAEEVSEEARKLSGFTKDSAFRQYEIEKLFSAVPSPSSSRRHHLALTEEPHVAGRPEQRKVAEYVLREMEAAGIEAEIVEYQVYLPYPKSLQVTLLEPHEIEFDLREEGFPRDKDSYSQEVIPPFNAYSPSGEAEGQVVYVNYGLPEDYEYLEGQGIDVAGKVVLARYGKSFRGVKVKVAEEQGASAILIYSDPFDDGYFQGDIYPEGPMRPPSGIQRGSVQYIFIYPGDPLTPGTASIEGAERVTLDQVGNMPSIPSQPISYGEASLILKNLAGANVPSGWQGALPFAYHIGPGPARVRMKLEMDYAVRPIWNVIGRIPGSDFPDEWVILGNHLDAWTYGAVDPSSGTTALIEVIRGLGELLKQGLRPKRTLVLAGWDGEEYGLIGSTEWAEGLKEELSEKAVAYLNVDSAVSGSDFSASAVPSLASLIREVVRDVEDPASGKPIYQEWLEEDRKQDNDSNDLTEPTVGELGSGSDYTVFLDHLGIPSLTMGFRGPYGVYHSTYDSHYWMDRFGDPGWQYHPAMAKIWGRMSLRLANADVLPLNYELYGESVSSYLEELEKKVPDRGAGGISWEDLREQATRMAEMGAEINQGVAKMLEESAPPPKVVRINELLRNAERQFLLEEGLPERAWFRHVIFAPGFYTGYASQPLPGLSQALDDGELSLASRQADLLLSRLKRVNETLDQIRRLTR